MYHSELDVHEISKCSGCDSASKIYRVLGPVGQSPGQSGHESHPDDRDLVLGIQELGRWRSTCTVPRGRRCARHETDCSEKLQIEPVVGTKCTHSFLSLCLSFPCLPCTGRPFRACRSNGLLSIEYDWVSLGGETRSSCLAVGTW